MEDSPIRREDVAGRARVIKLAPSDPREALKVARAIRNPWYRCQSLSKVAEHWGTRAQRMDLLHEALRAAEEQLQINRIVTVASWPLRLMVPIDTKVAKQHLERFIALANREPHTLRRANALFALANAMAAEDKLLAVVVPSLAGALVHSYGWRTDRLIAWSVEMVGRTLPEAVPALVARHRPGSKRRRLEQWMAANVIHT